MSTVLITGSAGLIGSESVHFFAQLGFNIVGIDNDMRAFFFGDSASTAWNRNMLKDKYGDRYHHYDIDIRDRDKIETLFKDYSSDITLIIHTAAQPSHDWAAKDPHTDFTVNANGTLVLLEATRQYCPNAVFIFTSTNKVYGDTPNYLPLQELETRWEIEQNHKYQVGIDESMSIDYAKHSLFGASKVAADILVQEYGRYFDMKTVSFRGGCLTGPLHSGAQLHGFLAYLMQCTITGEPYTIFGYQGKQVRDNIHSYDLVNAFYHFYQNPRCGEVYNMGGSRHSNCSMLEAITLCEKITGNKLQYSYTDTNRIGDHIWYISDVRKFQSHYPEWQYKYDMETILSEIYTAQVSQQKQRHSVSSLASEKEQSLNGKLLLPV
ncbi:MAG TPA: NAD-dependent epimerase [Cyanobacteria bacterium UBA11149]|nr:NAD-dependent epimerase [Cyanobacteria bacterium UBA11367]HBE59797.1 NAD-dependent epimerase [Cyanobacteria bacterium UBA11366]HBK64284.1 NAD-dependent epimerase [Cyanobacteria bacterium UBA11166]HBR72372.1 NAD-dependent epimerase [Cyanobacteria bacterium UBA11159]HBS70843.1 NAD-dependent epimerase [Cyanobacteria bacterium UBA11153]HBW89541.1 NAD-dependent epimerase [Cyanobacteria bacterium UBA11149]HCA94289.1 NAD-dependent epimerase [Cyanobacteria bacterium UBA9226]